MLNYRAPWWLPGGNLQTIWPALAGRRYPGAAPRWRRERWSTPDGDFVDLDWLEESDDAPTLAADAAALPPEGAGLARGGPSRRPDAPTLAADAAALPPEGAGLARGGPSRRPDAHMLAADAAARGLAGRGSRDASPLSPVPTCSSRSGASGSSASGAGGAQGGSSPRMDARPTTGAPPLLVLFHGLEGSSRSHYAEAFADVARQHGLQFVVPHFRGCSGELNHAPRAYHSGDYEEIGWILARVREHHSGPVLAVGVSLGGNALMRWAAESGGEAGRSAAAVAAVSSPLDLAAGGQAIGRGFNRLVYTTMFLRSMKPKALSKLVQHPGLFDREALLAVRDLYAFDNLFTAPLHGFRDADDYYARASARPHLHRIRIPALLLNARNDPFVPARSLPRAADVAAAVTLWQPAQGGHVGFPAGAPPGHVQEMPQAVVAWLRRALSASTS